jgi:hypothetical protein
VKDDDAAALAAIAAALAILATRAAAALPAPPPSRWRLAGRPGVDGTLSPSNAANATRWASAGRRG